MFHKVYSLYLEKNDDFDIASRVKNVCNQVKLNCLELFLSKVK